MDEKTLTERNLLAYKHHLLLEERAPATVEKYLRDVRIFAGWINGKRVTKDAVAAWKDALLTGGLSPATVNAKLSALNGLFRFLDWEECRVKFLKVQRQTFRDAARELTQPEYARLLEAARKLQKYAKKQKTASGAIFRTGDGIPLTRFQIWRAMKSLCAEAGVAPSKVFPHNLRRLFAVTFYRQAGHRGAGGHPGPQLGQHHPHLPDDHRDGTYPETGTTGAS